VTVFKLVAVPEDQVYGDGQGTSVMIYSNGPFELVNERNLAMLTASVEGGAAKDGSKVAVSRDALAVLLQYSNHVVTASLIGPRPDAELVTATAKLNEELAQ